MTFGERLRSLRQSRLLTQEQLAKNLGISQGAVTYYERDLRQPTFELMQRFADYFGVSLSSMMPSENPRDADLALQVSDSFHQNPKLRMLFDRARFMSESDLDAVLAVVSAISKERTFNE